MAAGYKQRDIGVAEVRVFKVCGENVAFAVVDADQGDASRIGYGLCRRNTDKQGAEVDELQAWCKANGASELAIPKRIVVIDDIPVLGSGKTDYVVLQRMAAERFAEAKAA